MVWIINDLDVAKEFNLNRASDCIALFGFSCTRGIIGEKIQKSSHCFALRSPKAKKKLGSLTGQENGVTTGHVGLGRVVELLFQIVPIHPFVWVTLINEPRQCLPILWIIAAKLPGKNGGQ